MISLWNESQRSCTYARYHYVQNTKSVDIATRARLAEQVIKLVKQEFKNKMNINSEN